jgi:hypothetical protein
MVSVKVPGVVELKLQLVVPFEVGVIDTLGGAQLAVRPAGEAVAPTLIVPENPPVELTLTLLEAPWPAGNTIGPVAWIVKLPGPACTRGIPDITRPRARIRMGNER